MKDRVKKIRKALRQIEAYRKDILILEKQFGSNSESSLVWSFKPDHQIKKYKVSEIISLSEEGIKKEFKNINKLSL